MVLFSPNTLGALYGIQPSGDQGVLMVHRGALFLGVAVLCVMAVFDPGARRAASLLGLVSVVGFLLVYVRAGYPQGPLVRIAWADVIALVPLGIVLFDAWCRTVR